MKLVTAAQIREMDRRSPADYGVPGLELMESAGGAVARVAREMLGADRRVLALCGKGNNGGDGLVAARLLQGCGYKVEVWLFGSLEALVGDARTNAERAVRSGVPIREIRDMPPLFPPVDLVIDAMLGTGLTSDVREPMRSVIAAANASGAAILAVDLPSGLDSDTGQSRGAAIRASQTVTFALPKLGLAQSPGMRLAGELIVAEIGMPQPLLDDPSITIALATDDAVLEELPPPDAASNKGSRGRLLVIAGAEGFTGAACLASASALRIGAGLVYLACPRSLNDIYETKLTEVVTVPVPEPADRRCFGPESVDAVAAELDRVGAVVLGPGLSRNERTAAFFVAIAPRIGLPTLIDADGLNLLSDHPETRLPDRLILTPHPGEMARLMRCGIADVQADRIGIARRAAERFGAVALLKGPGTVVADPDGRVSVNPTGAPALATAGTGDVLSGVIGGLLARGLAPFDAAVAGAYLHGLAGEIAAAAFGEEGVVAGDVTDRLPAAMLRLRSGGGSKLRRLGAANDAPVRKGQET